MSAARAELIHRTSASDANAAGDVHGAKLRRETRLAAPADLHELHALLHAGRPAPVA